MKSSDREILSKAADRLEEERLYEQVLREMELELRRPGIWAKALAHAKGDEQTAIGLYIEYRVQSIKDDMQTAIIASKYAEPTNTPTKKQMACLNQLKESGFNYKRNGVSWVITRADGKIPYYANSDEELQKLANFFSS